MLIADGYVHSLKALLDKSRAAETFPARRALHDGVHKWVATRVIGWMARWRPEAVFFRTTDIGG